MKAKDTLIVTTDFSPSLKMRLSILFCVKMNVNLEVDTEEVMPKHKAKPMRFKTVSFIDLFRQKFRHNRGLNAPTNIQ